MTPDHILVPITMNHFSFAQELLISYKFLSFDIVVVQLPYPHLYKFFKLFFFLFLQRNPVHTRGVYEYFSVPMTMQKQLKLSTLACQVNRW